MSKKTIIKKLRELQEQKKKIREAEKNLAKKLLSIEKNGKQKL